MVSKIAMAGSYAALGIAGICVSLYQANSYSDSIQECSEQAGKILSESSVQDSNCTEYRKIQMGYLGAMALSWAFTMMSVMTLCNAFFSNAQRNYLAQGDKPVSNASVTRMRVKN